MDADPQLPAVAEVAPPRELPRLKPKERRVAELHWNGSSNAEIARLLKRKAETVAKILREAPVSRWLAAMDERAAVRMTSQRVGARAKLAAEDEMFAQTMIDGVKEARKPLDKVICAEKALGLIGIVKPQEIHQFTVEAKLKDLSLEDLQAWERGERVPAAFAAEYAYVKDEAKVDE